MDKVTRRLAIFDCDGTLVDSQANICMAMEHAFTEAGMVPPTRQDIRRTVGLSLVEIMRVLLPDGGDDMHATMAEQYRNSYLTLRSNGLEHEPLYDGMAALLADMNDKGWLLAVATGKSDRGLDRCLDYHGIKGLFISLQTADRHPSKPHPSMIHQALVDSGVDTANAVMIGDTVYDIDMGVAAGCCTIGVGWGYHPLSELRRAGADALVETMDELQAALETING
jgi:phosphoglycolate phosphatase